MRALVLALALFCLPLFPAERVVASWYGKAHHGKHTAMAGVIFDRWGQTFAHRTAKLGSWACLVNPRNHRWCLAMCTDRGPYVRDQQGTFTRDIDVSEQVARVLRMDEQGIAQLELTWLEGP